MPIVILLLVAATFTQGAACGAALRLRGLRPRGRPTPVLGYRSMRSRDSSRFVLIGKVDVSWRAEVVAANELGRQGPQAGVGDVVPGCSPDQEWMQSDAAVGGREAVTGAVPP